MSPTQTLDLSQTTYDAVLTFAETNYSLDARPIVRDLVREGPMRLPFPRKLNRAGDPLTRHVVRSSESEAKSRQLVLDVNYASFLRSSDAVGMAPSPWAILSALAVSTSMESIRENLDKLRSHLDRQEAVDLVRRALRGSEQPRLETKLPALQKRALLELLIEVGTVDMEEDLLFHLEHEVTNEFLYACIGAVRLVPLGETKAACIAKLLRKRINDVAPLEKLRNPVERNVVRQAILALGAYGDPDDVLRLLELLRKDLSYELGDQTTSGLCQLLVRAPDSVPDSAVDELHRLADELLSQWTQPHVIHNLDLFAQSAQVVKLLCARLAPCDLQVALGALRRSPDPSLSRMMFQYVEAAREEHRYRGHVQWIEDHKDEVGEIEKRLNAIIHGEDGPHA